MTAAPHIIHLDEVDSTQRVARELAEQGTAAGTWVVAKAQTAGRGRLGRSWTEPGEGLFASTILAPRCAPSLAPQITLGAAAGAIIALDELGVIAAVKWPNDIVIAMPVPPHGRLGPWRKVAGLLVEVVRMRDTLELCVLGVGVNVRPPVGGWPTELALTAGALVDTGFSGNAHDVLAALQRHLPPALHTALTSFDQTLRILRMRSATLGRRVQVDDERGPLVGIARAIANDGALVVVDDEGQEHVVRAGDVWLRG